MLKSAARLRALSAPLPGARTEVPKNMRPKGWHRLYAVPLVARLLARHFHRAYYYAAGTTLMQTRWLGHEAVKFPADMWVYQEMLASLRPALVVETGTYHGGSALYLASIMDLIGDGHVLTIDVVKADGLPEHDRITYATGSSLDQSTLDQVEAACSERGGPVLVILDSDHARDHVLAELRAYSRFVTPGSWIVVEDTNVNGHPALPQHGPGPMEAVEVFSAESPDFHVDRSLEKFLVTANPRGYLRRVT